MNDFLRILITLAIAAAGGIIGYKLKLPAGAMIGAMVVVIVLNVTTAIPYIPRNLRVFIQMFAGMRIGSKITKRDVFDIRKLVAPAIILVISMVILNFVFGTLMYTVGRLDLATSLFACSPGGMTDMAIIADDMGANAVYVVVLQLSRILFIYLVLPPVFRSRLKKDKLKNETVNAAAEHTEAAEATEQAAMMEEVEQTPTKQVLTLRQKTLRFLATMAAGLTVGFIFWKLGVKAGALLGGMTGVALLNVFTGYTYFPSQLNVPIRIVAGAYIGQQMDKQSLMMMRELGIPVLIMWVGVLVFTFVVPLVIERFSKLDKATCMLASTPGGTQEMSLLAEDLGADVPKVTLLQTARQVSVLMIFPNMLSAITLLFGGL